MTSSRAIVPPMPDGAATCPAESAVALHEVSFHYGSRTALDSVSFAVGPGCVFGLLGPNGSGKTTLFHVLATLAVPAGGAAVILGADVVRDREVVRAAIGVVFQRPSLDGKLSVSENLWHQGQLYGLCGRVLRNRAEALLDRFGLMERAADRVETLSGGLRRRVEIAKALLHEPKVLILDEPSGGLDPGARTVLMDLLQELSRSEGVTVLLTTHALDEADRCDRIALLDRGRLVALDTPARLKSMIGGDVVTVRARSPAEFAAQATARFGARADVVDGVVRLERERGHEFVPMLIEAFPGEIVSVTVGRPSLADVFLHLTGHRFFEDPLGASFE